MNPVMNNPGGTHNRISDCNSCSKLVTSGCFFVEPSMFLMIFISHNPNRISFHLSLVDIFIIIGNVEK